MRAKSFLFSARFHRVHTGTSRTRTDNCRGISFAKVHRSICRRNIGDGAVGFAGESCKSAIRHCVGSAVRGDTPKRSPPSSKSRGYRKVPLTANTATTRFFFFGRPAQRPEAPSNGNFPDGQRYGSASPLSSSHSLSSRFSRTYIYISCKSHVRKRTGWVASGFRRNRRK